MKQWYESKTVWFNVLFVLTPAIAELTAQMGLIQPFLSSKTYAGVLIAVAVVNVLLRTITTQAIGIKK